MASSRKAGNSEASLEADVRAGLQRHMPPGRRLCVGLSGGLDSVVLLHLLSRLREPLGLALSAVHVHHGLSPNAGHWAAFCADLCAAWGVPLEVARVEVHRTGGQGIEAAARAARYAVFRRQAVDAIALAHHQDDQAETLLLQLLRGAGVAGLAAMPQVRGLDDAPIRLLRPLLDRTRAELAAYALAEGLSYVEDESNACSDFARNYLRHDVLPEIEARFPAYRRTLARAAGHFADCAELMDALAAEDLARARIDSGLSVVVVAALSRARARNLLRYWLAEQGQGAPAAAWLDEALDQLLTARRDARLQVVRGDFRLVRHRDVIHLAECAAAASAAPRVWCGEARLDLGEGGVLEFATVEGQGLSAGKLAAQAVTVRQRTGGEAIRPDGRRPRRVLKKLLQELGVPPWERERLPLLYCGETLVWAAGVGVDCDWQAGPGEPGWLIAWRRSRD